MAHKFLGANSDHRNLSELNFNLHHVWWPITVALVLIVLAVILCHCFCCQKVKGKDVRERRNTFDAAYKKTQDLEYLPREMELEALKIGRRGNLARLLYDFEGFKKFMSL